MDAQARVPASVPLDMHSQNPRRDPLEPGVLAERFDLTPQEARVARLVALGQSNDDIARELHISSHTARHHAQRIVEKLGATSRAALVSMLLRSE